MTDRSLQLAMETTESLDLATILDTEIDDDDLNIPVVDKPPTLESILNEPDDAFELDDVYASGGNFSDQPESLMGGIAADNISTASGGSGTAGSGVTTESGGSGATPVRSTKSSIQYPAHGSVLRHVMLKGISSQLVSAADRVDAGKPTALAVSSFIAIGTSHGLIMVFDPKQALKWCLGSTALGAQYGAVTALSINNDCSRLLSGFARGQMTMWDLSNGKLLRTITDAHPPGTAVLNIKFTDDPTLAICSDSGGSVFELTFKRMMGMRTCESRCLFSGSRGEVCTIEPLHMNMSVKDHPLQDMTLVGMVTLTKVYIVSIKPRLRVLLSKALKGDASCLPLLTWQFVIIQVSDNARVIDPVLAFARENTIHFYQVLCQDADNVHFAALQVLTLPYMLQYIGWLNTRVMVMVDTTERLHLVDVRREEELEVVDLIDVGLVYGSSHFKSLATGGNVSKALALAGERACYQSITSYSGQLFFLGTKSVHVMTLRTWKERIDLLVRCHKFKEALNLAMTFYKGKARAVVGLVGSFQKKKSIIMDYLLDLLYRYVDYAMTHGCPERGGINVLEQHFQEVVPICVDNCLILGRVEVLFGEIYDQFRHDSVAQSVFLECLEPYILGDRLPHVTPVVIKDFVEHYEARGMLQNVEACIVHLDVATLDIHQVVVLCWTHGLYDAIIYIYNKGMADYLTPLEELLRILQQAVKSGKRLTDIQIKLGNKLLVYISCCLAGRAYPLGDIPAELVDSVKDKVFRCITCLHTKDKPAGEEAYPYLRALLQFDCREFLNVLSLAFEEPEFDSEQSVFPCSIQSRQRVVDILLQVMVESVGFTPTQIGCLFTFLARQMAKHENSILVNRHLFEQVLEFLSSPDSDSRHEEREQALIELLNAGGLQQFDTVRLLGLAENAQFYRVCELLYEKKRQFDKILNCYLKDPARRDHSFGYVQLIMNGQYSEEEKQALQAETILNLTDLVSIDSKQTAELVLASLNCSLEDVLAKLKDNERLIYDFLRGVFEYKDSGSAIYSRDETPLDPSIQERFIELMCKFEEDKVYSYVRMAEGYRLEQTLQIVRRYKVLNAMAFLLERAGNVQAAFKILLETLQGKVREVVDRVVTRHSTLTSTEIEQELRGLKQSLIFIIQFCQRNSNTLDTKENELLWFPLLDVAMAPQKKLKEKLSVEHHDALKELTRQVLNSMMGYVTLTSILQKIMQDPTYSSGKFGDIKELILGMLDTYNYEETLLKTTNSLLAQDQHWSLSNLISVAKKGLVPKRNHCMVCQAPFTSSAVVSNTNGENTLVVLSCGHSYHKACLEAVSSYVMLDGEQQWICYECHQAKRGRRFTKATAKTPATKSSPPTAKKPTKEERILDPQQELSLEKWYKARRGPSRLAILMELSRKDREQQQQPGSHGPMGGSSKLVIGSDSILHNESFKLQLSAPPLLDDPQK